MLVIMSILSCDIITVLRYPFWVPAENKKLRGFAIDDRYCDLLKSYFWEGVKEIYYYRIIISIDSIPEAEA